MNRAMVLYHGNCSDGFGAAWAASKVLPPDTMYVPVHYGEPYPPEIDSGAFVSVFILDFSYPLETLLRLAACTEVLVIRDHHQTAWPALREIAQMGDGQRNGVDVLFDVEKSGAVLAWEYFHPGMAVPELLRYVEDRDLWRWALVDSRAINAAIRSYPQDFAVWDTISSSLRGMETEGAAILRAQAQEVEAHVKNAVVLQFFGEKMEVPVVNASVLMSEIGEALCEKFPDAPFSATFVQRVGGARVWSLRSRNGFDVGELAKQYGGGGHPAAAGFEDHNEGGVASNPP